MKIDGFRWLKYCKYSECEVSLSELPSHGSSLRTHTAIWVLPLGPQCPFLRCSSGSPGGGGKIGYRRRRDREMAREDREDLERVVNRVDGAFGARPTAAVQA